MDITWALLATSRSMVNSLGLFSVLCILTCSAQGLLAGGPHSTGTRISVSLRKVPLVQSWTLPSVFGNLPRAVTLCRAASASPRSPPPFLVLSCRLSPHGENATMSPARMLCLALRPADPGGARMVPSTGRGGEGGVAPQALVAHCHSPSAYIAWRLAKILGHFH